MKRLMASKKVTGVLVNDALHSYIPPGGISAYILNFKISVLVVVSYVCPVVKLVV